MTELGPPAMYSCDKIKAINDAFGKSSNRREPILRLFVECSKECGVENLNTALLGSFMERLHAAVSIIDDIVDGESLRNNIPTFHKRHSPGVAAIASIHLVLEVIYEACLECLDIAKITRLLIEMTNAEEADVGMILRPMDISPLDWYRKHSARKTAIEMMLMFEICCPSPPRNDIKQIILETTKALGTLLQMTNDWRDFFIKSPLYRIQDGDFFVVTYSLPFAIYAETNSNFESDLIGKRIDKIDAEDIISRYTSDDIRAHAKSLITEQHELVIKQCDFISNDSIRKAFLEIASMASSGAYWK